MAEIDPYAVLGVPRSASREEIARAYRRLAKQHHPDAGASAPSIAMARINDAWHILSDPIRRARWERLHTIIAPSLWAPAPTEPLRRPRPAAEAPPSPMDSGWMAIGILGGVALVVAVLMIGVSMAAQPADDRLRFSSDVVGFAYPPDWVLATGDETDPPEHRMVANLVTFAVEPEQLCTSFADPCQLSGSAIPPGEASIEITAWEGGTPPVPDPVVARPYGLDAEAIIGGKPAVFQLREVAQDSVVGWWQLSPPDFPDRWIEIRAEIGGQEFERQEMLASIEAVLETLTFEE